MGILFGKDRWLKIKETHRAWWAGQLERPLIVYRTEDGDPGRPEPKTPFHFFMGNYDFSISADAIADRWHWEVSKQRFYGDAFPMTWLNFGPGVAAAFMGAKVTPAEWTTWFHPPRELPITELHFEYDADNPWWLRVQEVARAFVKRFEGDAQIGMTDLGGNLDMLSTFRPAERLLLDLIDHPEDVKRCLWEAHELWHRYYTELNAILQPVNPGYSAWDGTFCPEMYYMLQCDFCYMISPEMFDEFVRPELEATCRRLTYSMYHLDGIGQLPHVPSLLSLERLDGIQWVMGEGEPRKKDWLDLLLRIRGGGKKLWLSSLLGIQILDRLADRLGSLKGCVYHVTEGEPKEKVLAAIKKYVKG
jgi:5-methyltetrahydrofolate--homocysteine methyltransferase